ncbi:magnesium ion transporter [Umbelopsis sp. WA50703]
MQQPGTCLRLYCRSLRRLSPTYFCRARYGSYSRIPFTRSPFVRYCKQAYSTQDTASNFLIAPREIPGKGIKKELKLRCTEFDEKGSVKTTAGDFLKTDLCTQHSLLPRDLRTIDTHHINPKAAILVRSEAILINLAHIRAVIKSDLVVLFDTFGSTNSYNQSIFIYDLQERLRSANRDGLPYEFRALEAMFISVVSSLHSELDVLNNLVTKLLSDLEDSVQQDKLKDLLQYTKKLSDFYQGVMTIRDAINEVLDQDEDLAAMYLTEKKAGSPRNAADHEEIELLMESYLKQTEEIANKAAILISHMKSTEEIVQIMLDTNRNSLLLFELKLTVATMSVGSGALIASLFGMNLKNFMEDDPMAFALVTGGTLFTVALTLAGAMRKVRVLSRPYC